MAGKLVKLKIIAYRDAGYSATTGDEFTTLINPESFDENWQLDYSESQAFGTSGTELRFQRTQPQTLKLNFLFDATGVIKSASSTSGGVEDIKSQVKAFKEVVLDFQGDIHSPHYVKIIWGALLFSGRLTNLNITYTLFKPDGTPLRAKAEAHFKSSISDKQREAAEDKSSPDLTHLREVQAGDTLPLMAWRIYGDSAYYLEVARYNQLDHFRALQPGQRLWFPPLDQA